MWALSDPAWCCSGALWRISPWELLAALALDALLGDPRGFPHIARFAGGLAGFYERVLTAQFHRSVALGVLFWFLVCGTMLAGYAALYVFFQRLHLASVLEVFVIYQSIAPMDLTRHALAILKPLRAGNLVEAREKLSWIVGRDTAHLDEHEISRATIESVAESTCDGVIAPLLWAAVAGAPGALLYRAANTLDSMVGHRDERYERFGKISARIDDALNWFPARIAAVTIAIFSKTILAEAARREASQHASPNAGWTEAAMAYVLGVRLGGKNSYGEVSVSGPLFNPNGRQPNGEDISRSLRVMWRATALALLPLLGISLLLGSR